MLAKQGIFYFVLQFVLSLLINQNSGTSDFIYLLISTQMAFPHWTKMDQSGMQSRSLNYNPNLAAARRAV